MTRRFQLVLQWPSSELTSFGDLVALEDSLIEAVGPEAHVDGHDLGSGEANIFILTDSPVPLFERLRATVLRKRTATVTAAYRAIDGDDYVVLWPPGETEFAVR